MKALWITLALLSMGCAVAQDVPPPPKPQDEGPSLEVTMKFLQDKLPGKVNYIVYGHDSLNGTDFINKVGYETSSVSVGAGRCRIDYHLRNILNGKTDVDQDTWFPLKQVQDIVVTPEDQRMKQLYSKDGHPEYSYRVDPTIFALAVTLSDDQSWEFDFDDETLSHRVAKALQHAVELCGGGSREPF
jgi:hypothetical protein